MTGTGPLGCVPAELALRSIDGNCAEEPQKAAALYNPKLVQMIQELNKELTTDCFVAVNALELQNDFISNPQAFGMFHLNKYCSIANATHPSLDETPTYTPTPTI